MCRRLINSRGFRRLKNDFGAVELLAKDNQFSTVAIDNPINLIERYDSFLRIKNLGIVLVRGIV